MQMTLNAQQQTLDASEASYKEMQRSDEMQNQRVQQYRTSPATRPSMRHETGGATEVYPSSKSDTTTNQP